MFDDTIRGLYRQGFTSGAIALRLGLSPDYVRQVISAVSGREVAQPAKPHYNAVADEDQRKHKAAVEVARKAAAKKKRSALEAKRAKAQQALEAAAAELSKLDAR